MRGDTPRYTDMTLDRGSKLTSDPGMKDLIDSLVKRVATVRQEQQSFRDWCTRADGLYYADHFTDWGADLWWDHSSATTVGRSHVSVNLPATYVDVPAALQAVEPIENMLAVEATQGGRDAAASLERVYAAWKAEEYFDLKFHKAAVIKSLYGRTAARIYWDDTNKRPCAEVIEQPRNLYMGYKTDSYDELEWAAYVMRYEPNALTEEYGVDVLAKQNEDGSVSPMVAIDSGQSNAVRDWLSFGDARIEVWDYWYREPVWKNGKFSKMETYNVVVAGNIVLRGPIKYPEYKGKLPYVPLFNTFIPGVPSGRSDLHDVEQLIREKFEKITAGSQMISNAVAGDYWQLIGPDAPTRVPAGLKPRRNELVGPGPGNRIEVITPFIAQFQLEQYLGRLDRELSTVSGLNDLLLGLAPAQVLSSSKAINALIANYESRISLRRRLLYKWRIEVWELALQVWSDKDKSVKAIVSAGGGKLELTDPSLSPRDDMETSTRAANLVNAKLWSQRRAMDAVGVDDPEVELDLIREESTDATLWPERVQVMAQLLGALQSLGLQAPAGAQGQAQGQLASGQADLRAALGNATPDNTSAQQGADVLGQTPPMPGMPPEAGGAPPPFAAAQEPALMQGMLQGGETKGRIMTQMKLGRR